MDDGSRLQWSACALHTDERRRNAANKRHAHLVRAIYFFENPRVIINVLGKFELNMHKLLWQRLSDTRAIFQLLMSNDQHVHYLQSVL